MPQTIMLPGGQTYELPDLPPHQHDGRCSCINAVGYIRVSDLHGRSGDEFISPQVQLTAIALWCESHGRRLVKLIFDIDKSGQNFDERSVGDVLEGIKAGAWKTVAMWQWSRWSRVTEEALVMIKTVESLGGEVRSCTQDIDPKQAQAKFMRGIHLLMAEARGDEIEIGWKNAHTNRRANGLPHSGRPRFGYDYKRVEEADLEKWPAHIKESDVGRRFYLPNDDLAGELVEAYRAYIAGQSLRSIVKRWNAQGLRSTRERLWSPQSLGKMLDTGFGAGWIRYRTNPPKKSPANRLASYDGWASGSHPPVISQEEWLAYRARREAQADLPPRSRSAAHSASALLFCGLCGCRLTTKYQGRNRTHQWVCSSRVSKHPSTHVGISNEMIMELLRDWLVQKAPAALASQVEAEAAKLLRDEQPVVDTERMRKELDQIDRVQLPNLIRLHMRGSVSDDQFDEMKVEVDSRARQLRSDLRAAEAQRVNSGGKLDLAIQDLASSWDLYRSIPEGHRELLGTVIAGVVISPGRGKLAAPGRVSVFPVWDSNAFDGAVAALRASSM